MASIVDAAKKAAELVKQNQTNGLAGWTSGGASGNADVQTTNTGGSPDYSVMINQAMKDGASADYVKSLLDQREAKIAGDSSLEKYARDSTWVNATEYINWMNAKSKAANKTDEVKNIYGNAIGQYQAAQEAQQQAIQASVDKSVNALKERIPEIEKSTANANTGAYNSYMKAVDPFGVNAQKEAYLGINDTGYSETNRARLGTTYQGAVNTNEAQKIALIEDIYAQIEEAKLSGDIEKANALAAYAKQIADLQMAQGNAILENSITEYQNKLDSERYDKETALEAERYSQQLALQKAETLAAYGDFSGYKAIGYSDAQISAMKAAYDAQQALAAAKVAKSGSSSSGSDGTKSNPDSKSWDDVMAWADSFGMDAAENYIKEHYTALGYSSQSAALAGWQNYLVANNITGDRAISNLTGDEEFLSDRANTYLFAAYANELDYGRGRYGSFEKVQNVIDSMAAEGIGDRDIALFLIKLGWDPNAIYG